MLYKKNPKIDLCMRIRYNSLRAEANTEMVTDAKKAQRANRLWWMHCLAALVHVIQFAVVLIMMGNRTLPEMTGVVQITQQITKQGTKYANYANYAN